MKNILLLSPTYPGPDMPKNATPVVHYFAREWVNYGYNVQVFNFPSNFPAPMLWVAKLFHTQLESLLNCDIRTKKLKPCHYNLDNVPVFRFPLSKHKPHGKYRESQINQSAEYVINRCAEINFHPDIIIGHWVNPQIEIMPILKKHFNVPTCLVLHDEGSDFKKIYKNNYKELLSQTDILGYRSDAIKRKFEENFGKHKKWFYCYSGVPEEFLCGDEVQRDFTTIKNFIFVGMMIQRKYPTAILNALNMSNLNEFHISYIGKGKECDTITKIVHDTPELKERVNLIGRVPRSEIKKHLLNSEVFVMISKNETFGLVYLEAMAAGCITIASRDEGFDGIIKDGVNGFLCKAGDTKELTKIINHINSLSPINRKRISDNAIKTAHSMTDKLVAKHYIEDIGKLVEE